MSQGRHGRSYWGEQVGGLVFVVATVGVALAIAGLAITGRL